MASKRADGVVRIAAVGDLHYGRSSQPAIAPMFEELADRADILVLCGDLTDYGQPEEARQLARELAAIAKVPIVAVLGNHDFESGHEHEVSAIFCDIGMHVLDGDSVEIHGVGFAGVKGFCGGFGRHALGHWGEPAIKSFVREALDEALKLETALARLKTEQRFAVLHYSPVMSTVEGEPLEIYPYLGSSRLEEPLLRYPVDAVFHGHAHHGQPQGQTSNGVTVYNVSMSLLKRLEPDAPPFKLIEARVPRVAAVAADG